MKTRGQAVVVTLARDARLHHELYPNEPAFAVLCGRIKGKYERSSKLMFLSLRDASEAIQILVDKAVVGRDVWDSYAGIQVGEAVRVAGEIGASKKGKLSVFPTEVATQTSLRTSSQYLDDDINGVGTQILLARLESRCRDRMREAGFEELAPRFLSSNWPEGGLQALRVTFPAQSPVPFFLAVSPNPQLMRAILAVGQTKFFTISKSFATNFIATQNGAEYSVATAIAESSGIDHASEFAISVASHMFGGYQTGLDAEERTIWDSTITKSNSRTLSIPNEAGEGLHLHIADHCEGIVGPGNALVTAAFNLVWQGYLTLAEGYEFNIVSRAKHASTTIHIERFLQLLRTTDNRRIRDLFGVTDIAKGNL